MCNLADNAFYDENVINLHANVAMNIMRGTSAVVANLHEARLFSRNRRRCYAQPARRGPAPPMRFACVALTTSPATSCPSTEDGAAHVSLWSARLGALSESALDARALRTLVLVAARLHHIESNVFTPMVTTLASLDLGYNEFTDIPIEALKHLRVLNWLNLQNNFISDLDSDIDWGGLSDSLSSLSLSNNQICVIRENALSSLRQLVQLELDGNRLRELEARSLPPSIVLLRLSDNLLSATPCEALASLSRLRHLHLRNNLLRPRSNHSCSSERPKIDSLDLSHNELTDSSNFDFKHGYQLKQLILDLNEFTAVPPLALEFGRLEKLSMSYNNISDLSNAMVHALKHSLERLELDHNKIAKLPPNIQELGRLRYLSVAYNDLEDIENLPPNLHTLLISGNFLSKFPSALQNMSSASIVFLDLSYNAISQVSADAFGPWADALATLSLRANRLTHLPAGSFPPLPLRELILSFNDLYLVEKVVFANLTDLKVLELSSTFFNGDFPAGSGLETLKWLKLDNNNIHYFSSADFQNFPSLEYLNLDFNKIIEFPSEVTEVSGFYKLRELRLSYNFISRVNPEFLVNLADLQSVDLSYNRILNASESSFANLPNLVYLSLAANGMEFVAEGAFSALPRLQALQLQNNELAEFSTRYFLNVSADDAQLSVNASYNRIASLIGGRDAHIRVLDLSHNLLESIPRNFFDALGAHVKQLYLSHNRIMHIESYTFSSLIKLDILHLQNNSISALRRRAFFEMNSLQILDLSHNSISQLLVEQFHNLRQLRHLKLNSNVLRALPRDIFKNTLLEYLDLGENQLALFPSSALSQVGFTLRRLELPGNRLEYLDVAMFHATAFLHELNLARNALTVLSDNTFAGLPQLRRLDLSYNAIKTNFKELFHNAPRLRRLSLTGIGLKSIPQLPLNYLTEINLSNNYIASYGESDVRHLFNLRALDISANKFTSLRPAMWAGLPRLISLDVSRNPVVRIPISAYDSLSHLLHLRMYGLRYLEAIEPKAFRPLVSLRSLSLESPVIPGRNLPIAEIVSAVPHLEALNLFIQDGTLDKQLLEVAVPKLRSVEVHGRALRRVAAGALAGLGRQRALALRLSGSELAALPAGLAAPLARVPHLALDFSDNQLTTFSPAVLYPNHTGWNRYATRLLPGGLSLSGNPLRCGCSSSWVGGWLRRWTTEVGGDSRGARAAAGASTCASGARRLPLLAQHVDEAECHASALSSPSKRTFPCTLLSILPAVVVVHSVR
ncbi:chaoptin-like [Colias croceus]|uniref:chaoptin-like n=1 Tax=Colias crocea TaxID=72248 RepID=UPI001E27CFEA|nr:chaoptin-like [Colias croceus]